MTKAMLSGLNNFKQQAYLSTSVPVGSSGNTFADDQGDLSDCQASRSDSPASAAESKQTSPENNESLNHQNIENYGDIGLVQGQKPILYYLALAPPTNSHEPPKFFGDVKVGWIYKDGLVEKQLKMGDINQIPAGSAFYMVNTGKGQRLHIICSVDTTSDYTMDCHSSLAVESIPNLCSPVILCAMAPKHKPREGKPTSKRKHLTDPPTTTPPPGHGQRKCKKELVFRGVTTTPPSLIYSTKHQLH